MPVEREMKESALSTATTPLKVVKPVEEKVEVGSEFVGHGLRAGLSVEIQKTTQPVPRNPSTIPKIPKLTFGRGMQGIEVENRVISARDCNIGITKENFSNGVKLHSTRAMQAAGSPKKEKDLGASKDLTTGTNLTKNPFEGLREGKLSQMNQGVVDFTSRERALTSRTYRPGVHLIPATRIKVEPFSARAARRPENRTLYPLSPRTEAEKNVGVIHDLNAIAYSTSKTPRGLNAFAMYKKGLQTGRFKKHKFPHLSKNLGLTHGSHFDCGQLILKMSEDPFQFAEKSPAFEQYLHATYEAYRKADAVDPESLSEMIVNLLGGDLSPTILSDYKKELLEVLEQDVSSLSDEDIFVELTNYILEHQPRSVSKPYLANGLNKITGKDILQSALSLRHLYAQYSNEEGKVSRNEVGELLSNLGIADDLEDFYDSRIQDWIDLRKDELKVPLGNKPGPLCGGQTWDNPNVISSWNVPTQYHSRILQNNLHNNLTETMCPSKSPRSLIMHSRYQREGARRTAAAKQKSNVDEQTLMTSPPRSTNKHIQNVEIKPNKHIQNVEEVHGILSTKYNPNVDVKKSNIRPEITALEPDFRAQIHLETSNAGQETFDFHDFTDLVNYLHLYPAFPDAVHGSGKTPGVHRM